MDNQVEKLRDDCVLIVGGGPVGLLLARILAHYEIKSVVLEKNLTTTKWPKMDLTNARSMELLRSIGLDKVIRQQGVPAHYPYSVIFSTGLNVEKPLTQWDLSSVDAYYEEIKSRNDGSMPSQPYQRISQAIFEALLKEDCDTSSWTDLRFGQRVEAITESDAGVQVRVLDSVTNEIKFITTKYLIGCDGASSIIRRSLQIDLEGGPVPVHAILVHFKSRDLTRIQKHGQFWHLFTVNDTGAIGGAVIAQDERETWTVHLFAPLDFDGAELSSEEIISRVLGGASGSFPITIDDVLVRSTYKPHIAVAQRYASDSGRIFLAGDAAHQNVPTGGYGMNMGIGDVFNIGWKLAANLRGFGGPALLDSYEAERKPVAAISIERSGAHLGVHMQLASILAGNALATEADTQEASVLRQKIREYFQEHDGENKDLGIEMGYRYTSTVCVPDTSIEPPKFDARRYCPSTYPGMRAPSLGLTDGHDLYDQLGPWYSVVTFSPIEVINVKILLQAAQARSIPLKHLELLNEVEARSIWQSEVVIVRPDHHVAWRGQRILPNNVDGILNAITGKGAQ